MSGPVASPNSILQPLDEQDLTAKGLLGPVADDGTRKLHRRRLSGRYDREYNYIPLNVPLSSPEAATAFVDIPAAIISEATLQYLGFSDARAAELWGRWTNWPANGPRRDVHALQPVPGKATFLEFVINATERLGDVPGEAEDQKWIQCLEVYGMKEEFRKVVMESKHASTRRKHSCAYWMRRTVEGRCKTLMAIRGASVVRETLLEIRAAANRDKLIQG